MSNNTNQGVFATGGTSVIYVGNTVITGDANEATAFSTPVAAKKYGLS